MPRRRRLACAVCGAEVDIAAPFSWRCPNATADDRHHVLQLVQDDARQTSSFPETWRGDQDVNPFLAFLTPTSRGTAYAAANGLTDAARAAIVAELDDAVSDRGRGAGFVPTPFGRADALSDALGFTDDGGVWVKDETGNVAGSHKARHLFTILLHLRAAEILGWHRGRQPSGRRSRSPRAATPPSRQRRSLAAAEWPIDVFVPTWTSDGFGDELDRLARPCAPVRAAGERSARRPVRAPLPRGGRRRRDPVQRAGPGERAGASTVAARSVGRWRTTRPRRARRRARPDLRPGRRGSVRRLRRIDPYRPSVPRGAGRRMRASRTGMGTSRAAQRGPWFPEPWARGTTVGR